jgi:hypothetical protein
MYCSILYEIIIETFQRFTECFADRYTNIPSPPPSNEDKALLEIKVSVYHPMCSTIIFSQS